ncbi:MAG: AbrB/MazE/SpoVT family DNA-binding domain-containing protein [Roseiarcus sp.]
MPHERRVRLFRNGRNQAVRIPVEFELPGNEALIRREGERLVIEPVRKRSLLEALAMLAPLDEGLPDVDEGQLPLRDVAL